MDSCDICESTTLKLYKCDNNCNYHTCMKCFKKLRSYTCPNCRGNLEPECVVLRNIIEIKYNCFRARKLINKKIMKTTIKHNLFKDFFNFAYDSLRRDEEYDDFKQNFENMNDMLTNDMKLYEHYLCAFSIERLEKIANKVS